MEVYKYCSEKKINYVKTIFGKLMRINRTNAFYEIIIAIRRVQTGGGGGDSQGTVFNSTLYFFFVLVRFFFIE